MSRVLVHRAPESFPAMKSVETEGGVGRRMVRDGLIECELEVWIDWQQLVRQLGERALQNKSGRAGDARGAVVVQIRSKKAVRP